MVWARLDDAILDNPKIAMAGVYGFALHVAAITWCCRNLTDGFVPYSRCAALLDMTAVMYDTANPLALSDGSESMGGATGLSPHAVASHLADIGLWDRVKGGYQIHDFLDYNPSREQVLSERNRAKESRKKASPERRKSVARTSSDRRPNVIRSSDGPDPDPVPEEEIPPGVPPLDEEPPAEPSPKPAQARYSEAYAEGQVEASGSPFPPPTKTWDHGAIARFTQTPGWGHGLRGEELLGAIRQWSRDFRRACDDRPKANKNFAPEGCEEWARGSGWRYRPPRMPQERRSAREPPQEAPPLVDASTALQDVAKLFGGKGAA